MIEFTLNVGDRLCIGRDTILQHVEKLHPKAVTAQMVRLGIEAPLDVTIKRGELVEAA